MCFFPGTFQRRKLRKSCHVRRHVHSVFHPTGEKWQECVARADTGTFSRYHWRDCGCLRKPLVSSGFSKRHTLGFNIQAPVVPWHDFQIPYSRKQQFGKKEGTLMTNVWTGSFVGCGSWLYATSPCKTKTTEQNKFYIFWDGPTTYTLETVFLLLKKITTIDSVNSTKRSRWLTVSCNCTKVLTCVALFVWIFFMMLLGGN